MVELSKFDNILVVAFDGLDYEKVRKYGCDELKQEEFGRVNIRNFDRFGTPWLWASFLTGKEHNFRTVKKFKNSKIESMETFFWKNVWPMKKWTGLRTEYIYKNLGLEMTSHTKEDLEHPAFLDQLDMDAYYVPAYNEYPFNEFAELASTTVESMKDGDVTRSQAFRRHRGFFLRQQEELMNLLDSDFKSMMFYFKFTDSAQHLLFNEDTNIDYMGKKYDTEMLYKEINELAKKIRESSNHDLVIFISDHGLSGGDHNENAFYSSNQEIGLENPELTDFQKYLVENVEKQDEIEGIDI